MRELVYVSCQPAISFYAWQVEVMLHNFKKHEIDLSSVHIVCSYSDDQPMSNEWNLLSKYFSDVNFFFYKDTRDNLTYLPSIVPHILKKHFKVYPILSNCVIFHHDCDMIFTKSLDLSSLMGDDICYLSDTINYIGAKYIKEKGFGIYEEMCKIVGINEEVPVKYQDSSGGAQYLLKNIDWKFWEKVEYDSVELYEFFMYHHRLFPETDSYHPIQLWTAGMWALLWNLWYFDHETKIVSELDFLWPKTPIKRWGEQAIFHNAGVLKNDTTLFSKRNYFYKLPYHDTLEVDETKCSIMYWQEVQETGKKTCLK